VDGKLGFELVKVRPLLGILGPASDCNCVNFLDEVVAGDGVIRFGINTTNASFPMLLCSRLQ
jgi:hypothetical protein